MHCKSCEILIEDRLEKTKGVKKVEVDLANNRMELESDKKIRAEELNKIFKKNGYSFLEIENKPFVAINHNISLDRAIFFQKWWWVIAVGIIIFFLILNSLGLGSFLNINSQSSLIVFFILGLVAGISTCGALMSGIILSYPGKTIQILIGRLVGYTILGAVLGMVGQGLAIGGLTNVLVVLISILMTILGLQMLGFEWAKKINLNLPKSISKRVMDKKTPWILGLLTVLLPCGFTLLTESVAVMSGNWVSGTLIMASFVAGSSIPLFLIGLSSEKFLKNQKTIGLLVLFFVIYNLNFQFGIINLKTLPYPSALSGVSMDLDRAGINKRETLKTENKETARVVKMSYTRFGGLDPNPVVVKKEEKVRLEIVVKENEYGCMSTILLPSLANRAQTLRAGTTIVMEFTPQKVGSYKFVCAMGVPHKGVVNVIE